MDNYLQQIKTLFKNVTLNTLGVQRDFYTLIADKDIDKAIALTQDRSSEVDNAIKEYNPQTHKVMSRPNKRRKNAPPYISEKLPRARQRYINEVELFFLLGKQLIWKKDSGEDAAYALYKDFMSDYYMHSIHRTFKRLAGAETEAAIVFHLYNEGGEMVCKPFVAARSTGYELRPLFDQFGTMLAFALGYKSKQGGSSVQHWDIHTPETIFYCQKNKGLWQVTPRENIAGKILVVYARQPKAWDGVEQRLDREEQLDSKVGDTNNYFADPIAAATADVIQAMKTEQSDRIGQLLQLAGKDSRFDYINPPQNSETRRDEKADIARSILFDTYTPDLSFESLKGWGTLTGAATKNAMILGYIKRDNRKEIYEELFGRERNVIIAILKCFHPEMKNQLDELRISFEFADPFESSKSETWQPIATLYTAGLISLEAAVSLLALTDAPEEEVRKIREQASVSPMENN